METKIRLIRLTKERTIAFKEEMQQAFEHGFQGHVKDDADNSNQWQVLPDKDFYQSLQAEGAEAYEAVDADGRRLGGSIINIDGANRHGELSFLCTPYFDRRNIHFYINCCGFHAIEFFNSHHRDPNMPEQFDPSDGLFVFEKRMK